MDEMFLGLSVVVTLRNPEKTIVHGLVAAVNSDTGTPTLALQNVFFPSSGLRLEGYLVEGHAIADIQIGSSPGPTLHPARQHVPQHNRFYNDPGYDRLPPYPVYPPTLPPSVATAPRQAPPPFADPAIVSVGKRAPVAPSSNHGVAFAPQEAPATPIKPATSSTAQLPASTAFANIAKGHNVRKPSAATLEGPFSSLDIADAEEPDSDDATPLAPTSVRRASITKTRNGKPMEDDQAAAKADETFKRTRRGGKARKKEVAAIEKRNLVDVTNSPEIIRRGKQSGWRQTPFLQDPKQPQVRTPGVISGKVGLEAATSSNRKTRRQKAVQATNGWATEDATDIQELPEFDFVGNLSKFDKRSVFNQIRNEDTTADEDRLVSFNRLARPGTHGGKNLHHTENVLESRHMRTASNSSLSMDENTESGRNSRRAMSHASSKRAPMRMGSGVQDGDALLPSAPASLVSRTTRTYLTRPYATSSHATGSPNPGRIATPPESPMIDSMSRSCLRLVSSNRRCHTITPGGMLAVEESAEVDFGLTEDLVAENAGRGIAEVALTAINPGGRRLARENPNARPVIVVLAGNHRGGARAVAAARQLQARGPKVMVALLGFERNADWDRDVRRQVDLFVKFGGSIRAWPDTEEALKRLHAPPELIIDALLGRNKEFDALADEDQKLVLGIVGWANKSRASVLAVETPSGVGGSTGEIAILEGEPLEVRAKYIVCLGAPRSGLLKALQNGAGRDPEWMIWVVDVGVNKPWRNAGVGGGKGIGFGDEWVVQVVFDGIEGVRA